MPNIRKFYLQNASGERFPLQGERGVYLTLPEGLGCELEPSLADLGRGFFSVLDDETEPMAVVAGTLVFVSPAYDNFKRLADWLAAAGSLLLIYAPGATEYQRAVTLQYVQKGELAKTRLLSCPVAFSCLSPWRRPTPTEISMVTGSGSASNRYPGSYPGRYGSDAAGAMTARIAADGHMPGALVLRYLGGITDPEIRLTGAETGKVYGICRLSGVTVAATDVLELSTLREDSHIRKISASGVVTELLPYTDLSQDPYPRPPAEEPAILSVTSGSSFSGAAALTVYYFFRTV